MIQYSEQLLAEKCSARVASRTDKRQQWASVMRAGGEGDGGNKLGYYENKQRFPTSSNMS